MIPPNDGTAPGPDLSLDRAILRCEHKSAPKCSCNAYATCAFGKGKVGQVTYAECKTCVTEARDAT